MKKKYLKRLFAAIFIGKIIKSLCPPMTISGGMGQAMLNSILAAGAKVQEATASYAAAKAASAKVTSGFLKAKVAMASSAVVLTSCTAYAIITMMNPTTVPPINIYIDPAGGYVNTFASITVEIEDPTTPLAVYIMDENNQAIPSVQQENHANSQKYTFQIKKNSTYQVLVTINDNLTSQQEFTVDCFDNDYPYIESYGLQEDKLSIYLEDETSGIDFSQVYFMDQEGRKVYPEEVWPEENLTVFLVPYPEGDETLDMELYFSDNAGNQARSTIHVYLTEPPYPESNTVQ